MAPPDNLLLFFMLPSMAEKGEEAILSGGSGAE